MEGYLSQMQYMVETLKNLESRVEKLESKHITQ